MARARSLKPALFKNEVLGVADPLLTILFQSLWCLADREGRLEDRPLRIKAETFPYREGIDINGYLTELERLEFIDRYTQDGLSIIQILNFKKHQNPHKTEKGSVLPEKPIETDGCALTVKEPLDNGTSRALTLNTDSFNPVAGEGADVDKSPPAENSKFKMHLDWWPSDNFETVINTTILKKHYNPKDPPLAMLQEFRIYWATRDDEKTQNEWEHKFVQQWMHVINNSQQGKQA